MQEGYISTSELVNRLEASPMTIWRDLKELEQNGLLKRVRGGAEYLPINDESGLLDKIATISDLLPLPTESSDPRKMAIGKYAARELIQDGDTIILEGGSTVTSIVPFIEAADITALTNGLNSLIMAQLSTTIEVLLCCGGVLNQRTRTFIGPKAEAFFLDYQVNKVFVSVYGHIPEDGFYDPTPLYDSMKRSMCSRADKTILLLDSQKLFRHGLTKVLDYGEVDILVTDSDAPSHFVRQFRTAGIDVHVAPLDQ
jgi:DeoR/GlpR family transcriptional regulator of sugar metabolism